VFKLAQVSKSVSDSVEKCALIRTLGQWNTVMSDYMTTDLLPVPLLQ